MHLPSWLRAFIGRPSPPAPPGVDNAVRMHIAASDPDFPAKREAAVSAVIAAIDEVALHHGFDKKPKSWAKKGALGLVSIHLQRSRFGFYCQINLGFQPASHRAEGPWAQDDFVLLGLFFPPDPSLMEERGTITYLDIFKDEASLAPTMRVLDDLALPWLVAHLTDVEAHNRPMRP
ncbi:hypothetical protein EOK75_09620 [Pseudorhodobacter turbinis]|uniref:DUF4304 domain-containing protein n=1 Tax=Pseudorhodobacter turbinis TaxID=2500533 RepID=A0A4P8EHD9_9RHOB|nr:DUF4304 domain-containing protein [Pseudorhodobacter turbinis]QCO55975.1 hypothetical protein EOK75_09620 [Pseudorhodobacter turbinis]